MEGLTSKLSEYLKFIPIGSVGLLIVAYFFESIFYANYNVNLLDYISFTELLSLLLPFVNLVVLPTLLAFILGVFVFWAFGRLKGFSSIKAIVIVLSFVIVVIGKVADFFVLDGTVVVLGLYLVGFSGLGYLYNRRGKRHRFLLLLYTTREPKSKGKIRRHKRKMVASRVMHHLGLSILLGILFFNYQIDRIEKVERNYHEVYFQYGGQEYSTSKSFHYIGRTFQYVFCLDEQDGRRTTRVFKVEEVDMFEIRRNTSAELSFFSNF